MYRYSADLPGCFTAIMEGQLPATIVSRGWDETVDVDGEKWDRFDYYGASLEEAIASLSEHLKTVQAQERVASRIIADGMDALVAAGVLARDDLGVRPFSGIPNRDGEPTD